MEIELLPLVCPDCGSPIKSTKNDNVHFCSGCGKAYVVKKGEWKPIKTIYAKPILPSPDNNYIYLPFWGIRTILSFEEKPKPEAVIVETEVDNPFSAFLQKKISVILKEPDAKTTMDFFIPGFGTTNRYLLMDNIGLEYTREPPDIHITGPKEMCGGKYSLEDIIVIAKALLLTMQEDSRFFIKYRFNLTPVKFFVIGVPFYKENEFFIDALKGKRMFYDAVENIDEIMKKIGGGDGKD